MGARPRTSCSASRRPTPATSRNRDDGRTPGTPTWIWSVVDDGLYVWAYNGTESRWYQTALAQRAGRITAGGVDAEVVFPPVAGELDDRIDKAYSEEYAASPYLHRWTQTGPARPPSAWTHGDLDSTTGAAKAPWATAPDPDGRGGLCPRTATSHPSWSPGGALTGGVEPYAVDPESADELWRLSAAITATDPPPR
ncbi:DUF2255 family protein [Rhodococcus opacus]|uniref:DUF2255 family protein n=1 Tax=Rhodococcus opacus TaxID=37919 RepID=UPI00247369AF|nr:DUF2255 family protein [Rhodococcus opacus]MDH6293424.1 hypothetical protein [Rhodococcus opacus]